MSGQSPSHASLEVYDLIVRGLDIDFGRLHSALRHWCEGPLVGNAHQFAFEALAMVFVRVLRMETRPLAKPLFELE